MRQTGDKRLFIPICQGYGAHLNGDLPATWRSSTNHFYDAVRRERSLLRPGLQILDPDPTLLAATLGCRMRMARPYRYEVEQGLAHEDRSLSGNALRRVQEHPAFGAQREALAALHREGKSAAVLFPGPWTLARQIALPEVPAGDVWEDLLDAAVLFLANCSRPLFEAGARDLFLWEELGGGDPSMIKEFYGSLYNVVSHFKCRAWVISGGKDPSVVGHYRHPVVSGVLFPGLDVEALAGCGPVDGPALGGGIPDALLSSETGNFEEDVASFVEKYRAFRVPFLCPTIPHDANPEKVLKFVNRLRQEGE